MRAEGDGLTIRIFQRHESAKKSIPSVTTTMSSFSSTVYSASERDARESAIFFIARSPGQRSEARVAANWHAFDGASYRFGRGTQEDARGAEDPNPPRIAP